MPIDTHTARMDLSLSLAEHFTEAGEPAGIGGAVEFRTDVFDAESVEALIARFERVLVAMTTDPHGAVVVDRCARRRVSASGLMSSAIGRC